MNIREEALLVLTDLGIDAYLPTDAPITALREALTEELEETQEQPTLYDAYNAATRALTHAEGISAGQRDRGLEQAARLLDRYGDVPDAATLGQQAVERRIDAYADDEEVNPYWEDEEDALQTLIEARGVRG